MIRFVGDIHGDYGSYYTIIEDCEKSVQVGDFGIGFRAPPVFGMNHRFIRGNHDDPDLCKTMSNWIPDGTVEDDIMYCGGAWSIDQEFRTPGVSWWFNEELNDYEFEAVYETYKAAKPTLMVSHDLPQGINDILMPLGRKQYLVNRTNVWFKRMFEAHKPEAWIAGHHHPEKGIVNKVEGTTFIVLPINGWIDIDI